jgi:hypothetical protein
VLRTSSLRVLDARDTDAVLTLCARDPVVNTFVASRVEALGTDSWRLGAELWGHQSEGTLDAVCHAGANLVLVEAGPRGRARLRRTRPPPGPPLQLHRRSPRAHRAALVVARADLGPGA